MKKSGTDTFFLEEGQNIFCPYITVEEGYIILGAQYFVPLS
jgi:hypothetical protein